MSLFDLFKKKSPPMPDAYFIRATGTKYYLHPGEKTPTGDQQYHFFETIVGAGIWTKANGEKFIEMMKGDTDLELVQAMPEIKNDAKIKNIKLETPNFKPTHE